MGVAACGVGAAAGLSGLYTLEEALQRLLQGAPCGYRVLDPRTVRIAPLQPTAPSDAVRTPTLISEVVVTATKRPVRVAALAADVSVISREQLETTAAADVTQTTAQLAGVLTTNLGPGRDKLLIRGLSDGAFTGRARSTVATYVDETPINYNAPDPDLRLVDVDRIEVVRGPQGALYGSGSISGIYRIVTAKPELDRLGGGGALFASRTEGGAPSWEAEGYANLPVLRDRAALRLVGYYDVQGGFLDNINLRIADVDRTVRTGGRAAFRWQLSDAWQLDLAAVGQRLRSNDSQYTTEGLGPGQRANRVREAHKNDFAYGGATLRGELGWASLSASLGRVRHVYTSQYDASNALSVLDFLTGAQDIAAYLEGAKVTLDVGDLYLHSTGEGRLDWLVGIYGARTRESTPSRLSLGPPSPTLPVVYTEHRRNHLRETAIYGEASYAFAPGWSASVGGRLFETRVHTFSEVVGTPPGAQSRQFDRARRFAGFSPKISLQHEFASGDLVYLLVSEGYRAGGFNTSGFLQIRESRIAFAPDHLRNYELGAKLRLLNRRLTVRSALYYDEWRNIQTDQYRPSGLSYTGNAGDARIAGLEAEVGYDWDFGLSLQANGLVSESRMTRINPVFLTEVVDELPGVPRLSGGMLAIYQRPLRGNLKLRLSAEAGYVGRSGISFDPHVPTRTRGYTRARLSADVLTPAWSAGLFVLNPTDEAGDTFAYGNPFALGPGPGLEVRQATPQRPRTIAVRLGAAF